MANVLPAFPLVGRTPFEVYLLDRLAATEDALFQLQGFLKETQPLAAKGLSEIFQNHLKAASAASENSALALMADGDRNTLSLASLGEKAKVQQTLIETIVKNYFPTFHEAEHLFGIPAAKLMKEGEAASEIPNDITLADYQALGARWVRFADGGQDAVFLHLGHLNATDNSLLMSPSTGFWGILTPVSEADGSMHLTFHHQPYGLAAESVEPSIQSFFKDSPAADTLAAYWADDVASDVTIESYIKKSLELAASGVPAHHEVKGDWKTYTLDYLPPRDQSNPPVIYVTTKGTQQAAVFTNNGGKEYLLTADGQHFEPQPMANASPIVKQVMARILRAYMVILSDQKAIPAPTDETPTESVTQAGSDTSDVSPTEV